MLRVKVLQEILRSELAEEPSIKNILVSTADGAVVAYGARPTQRHEEEDLETACAVLVGMYSDYIEFSSHFHSVLADFAKGVAVVGAVGSEALILVLWGAPQAPPGLLQAKFDVLHHNLSEALVDLFSP